MCQPWQAMLATQKKSQKKFQLPSLVDYLLQEAQKKKGPHICDNQDGSGYSWDKISWGKIMNPLQLDFDVKSTN